METALSFTIMFVGLGFFLLIVLYVARDHRETQDRWERRDETRYNRELNEKREFGAYQKVENRSEVSTSSK